MAITFVNKGTWAAGTTSISPGIPASMQAGDFMILQVHTCNQAVTTPSGWTQATTSPVSTGTANTAGGTRISVYYRWWQSGDAAPTVAVTGGTVTNGIIVGYRGVDPTTPFDGVTPVATTLATASTTLTMTGITTVTANTLIHWSVARDQDLSTTTAVTAFTNGNLTGITEIHDQVVNTGVGGGIWCGYGFKGTAGATGNLTITQTSSIAVGITFALRPAPKNYPLTCLGGSYSLTGSSAGIDYVGAKPVRISTTLWQQDLLGTTGTPGAKAITVPADAQAVVVQAHTGYGGSTLTLSITSDFAGTFTVVNSGEQNNCSVGYALVSSTGSKNLTLAWSSSLLEGPTVYISFIKNINTSDWVREVAAIGTSASGSSASNVFDTSVDDLLLVVNDNDSATPSTISGFTSLGTTGTTYSNPSRFQSCNAPGATTTTVTGTSTNFDVLSGISIKPNVSGAYSLVASGGSYSLTGSQAVLKRNRTLTTSGGSYTLTGQQTVITWSPAVNHYTLTALSGSYSYSGASVGISRNRKLTSNGGAYTVTGGTATLLRSKRLVTTGGAYVVTGASANVNRNRKLTAIAGSYLVAGSSISISRNRNLIAQGGTYTYTGQQIVITYTAGSVNYTLTALGGAYAIDGSTALLARNRTLVSSGGSYSYTGSSATLLRSKYLSTTGGVYSVTGATANLFKSKRLIASGGSYTYTGNTVTLKRSKYLNVSGGSYSLVGSSATITWTGVGGAVWPPTHVVLLGTVYGPTGTEYTGTLDVNGIKYDITTGQLVKPLNDKVVMSL